MWQGGICLSYPLGEHLGPRGLMNWPTLSYHTAVIAAPVAGDSSARACQIGAYLSWHLLMEAPFSIWSRQWPWYSWWRIKAHKYCFKKERLVACASHPLYQIIRLKLIMLWTLVLSAAVLYLLDLHTHLTFPRWSYTNSRKLGVATTQGFKCVSGDSGPREDICFKEEIPKN